MCEVVDIASAEDVDADRQLVAGHARLRALRPLLRNVVRIDVDDLDHPVAVGAAGRREQVHLGAAHDVHRRGQRRGGVADHVRAAVDEALVAYQPAVPLIAVRHVDRPRQERHRVRRVGHIFVVARSGRSVERRRVRDAEVQRGRRAHRPARAALPPVHARRIGQRRRNVRVRRTLQIMIKPRFQILRAPLQRGVAGERNVAELVAVMVGARMPPWPDH
jgi:hypothetical protein